MIYDITIDAYVAAHPVWAHSWWSRTRGMIGRNFDGETLDAMIFEHCRAVHSCWMSIPLDLLFLDSGNTVVALRENLRPWKLASGGAAAVTTIELPAGRIAACGVRVGDILNLNSTLNPEKVEKLQVGTILRESVPSLIKPADIGGEPK